MKKIQNQIPMERLMGRQMSHWLQTRKSGLRNAPASLRPAITISKEVGSGGMELGTRLHERLDWKIFDREIVEAIAKSAHVREAVVESFDEKTQNEIHNWVNTLVDRHNLSSDIYFMHLVTVIASLGRHGQVIIVGRGGHFILSPQKTLRLRIIASRRDRIGRIVRSRNVPEPEAEAMIDRIDSQRKAFIRRFFHKDADNALFYDLVLNTSHLTPENAEDIAVTALQQKFPQIQPAERVPA